MLASVHQLLGQLNRGDDPRIGSAAADVAFHGLSNLSLVGMRSFSEQSNAGYDHAWRAVAALHRVGLNERFLHRMKPAILRNALNSCDLLSSGGGRLRNARPNGRSIDQHGASSALALATSIFTAGEFQFVAQDPKEHAVRVDLEAIVLLIDDEFHISILRLLGKEHLVVLIR